MSKRYFWLKLQDGFFIQKEIKKLRKIAGGDTFTIIYLKLQLLSLKNEGKLEYDGIEDTFIEEMALELDEETENVKMTILFLQKHKLIIEISNTEFLLPYAMENMGSETEVAERVRKYRDKQKLLHSNTDVTICNGEREKEREKEIEKEKEIEREIEKGDLSQNDKALELCTYYSELKPGQTITQHLAELNILIETYTYEWVKESLEIVINKKGRFIQAYMETILKNWTTDGKGESNGNRKNIKQNEKVSNYYDSAKLRGKI